MFRNLSSCCGSRHTSPSAGTPPPVVLPGSETSELTSRTSATSRNQNTPQTIPVPKGYLQRKASRERAQIFPTPAGETSSSRDEVSRIAPPLQRRLSAAAHPYPDWNLQAVASNHKERLHHFFIHKGGFSSQESAERFWQTVLALTKKYTPAEPMIRILREAFQAFPEAATYGQRSAEFNTDIAQQMSETLQGSDSRRLIFPNGKEKPDSFIDIGCGEGQKTSSLASSWGLSPENAIGLDIVQHDSLPDNISFKKMSPDALPETIQPNSQDLVTISMVLHHASAPEVLLKSAYSALKPGGYLVVRDHNATTGLADFLNTVHIFYDNVFEGKEECMPNVQNYKSLEDWERIFEEQGFEHIKTDYTPFSTDPATGDPKNTGNNFTCVLKKKEAAEFSA